MRKATAVICSLFFIFACFSLSFAEDKDYRGSKDHPLLSRMPGFHISDYKEKEFESYKFIGSDKMTVPIEGHYYSITYHLDKGAPNPGELKVVRNIQNALQRIGGKVIYEGGRPPDSTIVIKKDGRETWVEVKAYTLYYRLTIVEKEAMQQEVVANAEAMGSDISSTGHASVYGIYFDTGRAEIKPESDAAISEIAGLLKDRGALKLYVVGHTDNEGSFDSNMKLSRNRADSVVKALTRKYGIAEGRLKAYGVASLSPVASNSTEGGRANNRRVELVEQ